MAAKKIAGAPHRYSAAERQIEEMIRKGSLGTGSRILGERELSRGMGVSRVTLRKALHNLKSRGVLYSDENKGWFVAAAGVNEKNLLRSFTELARSRGLKAWSKVLASTTRAATVEEAEILQTDTDAMIFETTRVRYMEDEAIGIETSRVPLARVPGIVNADLATKSLHAHLKLANAAPAAADYMLSAISAREEQAGHLGIGVGAPLLSADAITRDKSGHVVEFSSTVFRGDRYRFHTTLRDR